MVELLLFLSTFCLFSFFPVQFQISYTKLGDDDQLILEMSFLNGLLKRRRRTSLLNPKPPAQKKREVNFGKWFFYEKSQVKIKNTKPIFSGDSRGLREFLDRYRHFGLGMTLLTYFLPAKYHHWLLVTEDLEKRGRFHKFSWAIRFGTGEPAGTAIVYGLFWGISSTLIGYLNREINFANKPEIRVIPDFKQVRLDVSFDCIFRIKLGYIIIAALLARFRHWMLKGGVGIGKPSY